MGREHARMGERKDHQADALDREVRRRVADLLASAGVDQGRISQEILWMLPPELVRTYRELWRRALRPDVQSSLQGSDPAGASKARNLPDSRTGGRTRQGWAAGASRGKRYATHWVVADERLLKIKSSADRKLRRIAAQLERALADPAVEELPSMGAGGPCPRCGLDG